MRRVWERPEEARAKAERAREDIHRLYAPEVVGRLARARLERLAERSDQRRGRAPESADVSASAVRAAPDRARGRAGLRPRARRPARAARACAALSGDSCCG